MKTALLRRARAHFFRDYIPAHISRHNARQWARSLRLLGDKWLLMQQVERRHVG